MCGRGLFAGPRNSLAGLTVHVTYTCDAGQEPRVATHIHSETTLTAIAAARTGVSEIDLVSKSAGFMTYPDLDSEAAPLASI